jgi:redox-regulated HSP33 family molecular chaperone
MLKRESRVSYKKLNKDELNEIADEKGNIKVICEFCKMERSFNYV